MSLYRTLYDTLLNGRAYFVYFYWRLRRGSVIVYLCILWRFLVTWIHANILTTPLMRKLFCHRSPYLLPLILWRFLRMFSEIALLPLWAQSVCCYVRYHCRVKMLHRRMWKQWSLIWFLCVYSYPVPLYQCIFST